MVQYLANFITNLSDVSAPLENDILWHWEEQQKKSFEELKTLITNVPVLKFYDVSKPVTLSVDASSEGLRAMTLQEGNPVAYGSRSLTDCQKTN